MAAPAPQQQRLLAILATQSIGDRLERTIEDGAIVIRQRVESGFHDQTAHLDQVTRTFAAAHDPCSLVMPRLARFMTVPSCRCSLERQSCRYQCRVQARVSALKEYLAPLAPALPPGGIIRLDHRQ